MNNLSIKKKEMSFAGFKVKQRNIFSGDFWESKGGKISSPMDHRVGTADGQSEGLQVLGIGESWPIYLEGMKECYVLEPLVI